MEGQVIDGDVQLMLRAREGDTAAFARLIDTYVPLLRAFAYRYTAQVADAEDIAQDVLLKAWRARGHYVPTAKFSTWLYRIAVRSCLDYKRSAARDLLRKTIPLVARAPHGEEYDLPVPDTAGGTPQDAGERTEERQAVQAALAQLPPAQRIALILKVYENASYADIAAALDCSISAVESLLFRARQSVRQALVAQRLVP